MNSLEQYLKPPMNNQEEMYNEEGERNEEENEFIQNQENGNDNGENQDILNQQGEIEQNKNFNNQMYEEENNDIIQGINSIKTIENKNLNENENENENDNENEFENEDKNMNININNAKNEFDYNNNFLNINENTEADNLGDLMNDILSKIHKLKENRAQKNNNFENAPDKLSNTNNFDSLLNPGTDKTKIKNKSDYIGKLSINNKVFQNNPKMKELANLLKDYNQDKNENDKMQINFYNNNKINIIKPEAFFNNKNNNKTKNIDFYEKNFEKKHYISVIDGKAIIKGQRINVDGGFKMAQNDFKNKKFNFKDDKNIFDFNIDKLNEKKDKLNHYAKFGGTDNNLDFQLNNFNFSKNNEIKYKPKKVNIEDNKVDFRVLPKRSFFTKDYYNEELNKINNSLFSMDKDTSKIKK